MENKKFMKIPKGKFERLIYSGHLAESLSGRSVTKEELEKEIAKLNLILDEQQKEVIKKEFSIEL